MNKTKPNKKLLNKLYPLKIIGKGAKGDFFGRIDNVICFVTNTKGRKLKFDEIVDIKIAYVTDKCLFADVIEYDDE